MRSERSLYSGGDIGELYPLIDRATEAGFGAIQFTPIQDTGLCPVPYMGISIFSFNPIHLSVERLDLNDRAKEVKAKFLAENTANREITDYVALYNYKNDIFRALFEDNKATINFANFDRNVLAYALFIALKKKYILAWNLWPTEVKSGKIEKILTEHKELNCEVNFILFCQTILKKQWLEAAAYAGERGIDFIFDKPIYPDFDSAEVWANQDIFYLKYNGSPKYVSGCNHPGDPFGAQIWGHAVYQFKEKPLKVTGYFIDSIRHMGEISKIVRLDHTLALVWKYYIVDPVTKKGKHLPAINGLLFSRLKKLCPDIYFIAEDVGYISEKEVDRPLKSWGLPGMRCLQWNNIKKYSEIDKYPKFCFAMTSNHDLPSFPSWWNNLSETEAEKFFEQLDDDRGYCGSEVIRLVFRSRAMIASITLRDMIGDTRRYNLPGECNPSFWLLHSLATIEETDFSVIGTIIRESERTVNKR